MDLTFDLAVVGGGPAGLEACAGAAAAGLQTVLIDSGPHLGGQYFKRPIGLTDNKDRVQRQRRELIQKVETLPVTVYQNTLVWAGYPNETGGWLLTLYGRDAPGVVRARAVVIATGAYDLPLPFSGWTLPGVITAGAALTQLKQGSLPGKNIVLAGSGPLQLALASALVRAGLKPISVLEAVSLPSKALKLLPTVWGQWSRLQEGFDIFTTLLIAGVPFQQGWSVVAAHGQAELEAVEIARLNLQGHPLPDSRRLVQADTLIIGYGLLPNNGLARLMGCRGAYARCGTGFIIERDEWLESSQPGVFIAGDSAEIGGAALARLEGRLAGLSAARLLGRIDEPAFLRQYKQLKPQMAAQRRFAAALNHAFSPNSNLYALAKEDTIICRCEEITLGEIRNAIASGARSPNEIKLLTRSGMGLCQGRICEHYLINSLRQDHPAAPSGAFTIRPPLHPLPLDALSAYTQYE